MKCDVVIGANFGDEGKGRMVSYLAWLNPKSPVIRFNGSCQASHTVTMELDGNMVRHAFRHLGSGTFTGNPTYFTQDFVVNPMLFWEEVAMMMNNFNVVPRVLLDPRCIVATPFDMMINQWLEISRGASRHGSCGFGMNETVTRSENNQFKLTFENKFMQMTKQEIYEFIISIRDVYFKTRIEELGLVLEDWMVEIYNNESIVMNYIEDLTTMMKMVGIVPIEVYLKAHDHVIFEGAQGLGLDQTHGVFPHVTRSNTGMHNVAKYLCEDDIVNIHYMTRSYLTRHGAGPFEEDPTMKFEDLNNVPNEWQGTMKFGVLNVGDMRDRIEIDLIYAKFLKNKQVYINITCLDQVQFFTCKDSKFNKFGNISVLPSNEIGVRDMIETMIPFAKVNKLFYGHNFSDVR